MLFARGKWSVYLLLLMTGLNLTANGHVSFQVVNKSNFKFWRISSDTIIAGFFRILKLIYLNSV